jgi:hypothetical protein
MAAKTLYEYLDECDFSDTKEGQMYALVAELAWKAATKAAEEKFTPTNNARDEICPHWEIYNRGGSGEFGVCNCGGKINDGQTSPVA